MRKECDFDLPVKASIQEGSRLESLVGLVINLLLQISAAAQLWIFIILSLRMHVSWSSICFCLESISFFVFKFYWAIGLVFDELTW